MVDLTMTTNEQRQGNIKLCKKQLKYTPYSMVNSRGKTARNRDRKSVGGGTDHIIPTPL